ncbi:AraC family transcriptional regulator [Clostridium sp. AM58-1XD]|uniref:AraC family transcriptional regulator n=1 Tax=Clostridium sp. AM58-1XD TaxID=2292307 RepID=UPI000E4B97DD|nr:AraC family transcriptional regulator [Clostridium sp. AM58-1XD]RGZ01776.1 AraC family transcriptional regulator [Clostridium sp. AM58-1XD]
MRDVQSIEFKTGSKEEVLPGFTSAFPYISSCARVNKYIGGHVPWHWHKAVELFYIQNGELEYYTPGGKLVFPAGSGGFVNSNVLHMTKPAEKSGDIIQFNHIFDVSLISGVQGGRIEQNYIVPVVTAAQLEIIGFFPEKQGHEALVELLKESFCLSDGEKNYEMKLRSMLSQIWCGLLDISADALTAAAPSASAGDLVKIMLAFIYEQYAEKITVAQIAEAAHISQRACFRLFQEYLHTTPLECLKNYRLQRACTMLAETDEPLTAVCHSCGLGSSSYFGKVFRSAVGCTPTEYRNNSKMLSEAAD